MVERWDGSRKWDDTTWRGWGMDVSKSCEEALPATIQETFRLSNCFNDNHANHVPSASIWMAGLEVRHPMMLYIIKMHQYQHMVTVLWSICLTKQYSMKLTTFDTTFRLNSPRELQLSLERRLELVLQRFGGQRYSEVDGVFWCICFTEYDWGNWFHEGRISGRRGYREQPHAQWAGRETLSMDDLKSWETFQSFPNLLQSITTGRTRWRCSTTLNAKMLRSATIIWSNQEPEGYSQARFKGGRIHWTSAGYLAIHCHGQSVSSDAESLRGSETTSHRFGQLQHSRCSTSHCSATFLWSFDSAVAYFSKCWR